MDISFLQESFNEISFKSPTLGCIAAALIALALLGVSAFASGSEIAFFSLSPSDLDEMDTERNSNDAAIQKLRNDSERTLATILITNNFVNVTIIMLLNYVFSGIVDFGNAYLLQFFFVTILLTFLLLLFGEIMPKVFARQNPLAFCRRCVGG